MIYLLVGGVIGVAGFFAGAVTLAALYARHVEKGYVLMKNGERHEWIKREYVQGGIWDVRELQGTE